MTIKTGDLEDTICYTLILLVKYDPDAVMAWRKTWANEREITLTNGGKEKKYEIELGLGKNSHPLAAASIIMVDWLKETDQMQPGPPALGIGS